MYYSIIIAANITYSRAALESVLSQWNNLDILLLFALLLDDINSLLFFFLGRSNVLIRSRDFARCGHVTGGEQRAMHILHHLAA